MSNLKSKLMFVLCLLFLFSMNGVAGAYAEESENTAIPTEEQVQKLADAAWKEPIKKIDITFYKDYTEVAEPVEQLRKTFEEIADKQFKGRSINELKPYEIERRNKFIEMNIKNQIEKQKFPRKVKSRVRTSGDNQRLDSVKVGPNEPLGLDTPFVHTFINRKDADTGDLVSYHYSGEMNTVFVDTRKWAKEKITQFAGIPFATALSLQFFLGIDQGSTPTSLNYIPDPSKMEEISRTGLASMGTVGAKAKANKVVSRISIRPAPNASDTKDIIEFGDPDNFPSVVLICDKKDYSRIYRMESHIPGTDQITYIRECDNFDSNGFPHNVTETRWDRDGTFVEKSVYRIIKVELNPSMPADVFEFHPPEGCKVVDYRPKKP